MEGIGDKVCGQRWAMLGAGFLCGDSIISPAISVLAAVEGLEVATPMFRWAVIPITVAILALLFAVQHRGTSGVGPVFGPVLIVWFMVLAMDTYSTTEFPGLEGKLFEGLTLRLFDPKTRLWSLYWIASNTGRIDPPVVGSFDKNGIGHFFGKDTLNGKPILVVFRWDARNKNRPWWGQAFSPDNGKTWEWNFFNISERPGE